MNCLETQSKIMAFIDNKLPDDELKEFIKHVKSCDNCAEELEIYYTLIVGTRQLDNEQNLSLNFKDELENRLDEEMNRMTAVKRIAASTIVLVLAAVIVGLVWIYNGILDRVYQNEQNTKLSAQTEYYYSDNFGMEMNHEYSKYTDILDGYLEIPAGDTDDRKIMSTEFMGKIKTYNKSHLSYNEIAEVIEDE